MSTEVSGHGLPPSVVTGRPCGWSGHIAAGSVTRPRSVHGGPASSRLDSERNPVRELVHLGWGINQYPLCGWAHADAAKLDPALATGGWPRPPANVLAHLYTWIEVGETTWDSSRARRPRPPPRPGRARLRLAPGGCLRKP
jgi:hypothetical protein